MASTGSTNADLLKLARDGVAEDDVWLRAERQTDGRGRQGRAWCSPGGNLYASTSVGLRPGDPPAPTLALLAAVALDEAVRAVLPTYEALQLKWPNDLLIGGAKLSGILLERVGERVVIGVGVNVTHHPALAERATTSLHAAGAAIDAAGLLERLAPIFSSWVERWRDRGVAPIAAHWSTRAHPEGTELSVRLPDGSTLAGSFEGLDANGALRLRLAGGGTRVIHAGDVFLI